MLSRRAASAFQFVKERMSERLGQSQPSDRFVNEHFSNKIKHIVPVLAPPLVFRNVSVQRFAVLSHISSVAALLVPVEPPVGKILHFCLGRHARRNLTQDSLHHGEVFAVVVSLEQRDAQSQLKNDAAWIEIIPSFLFIVRDTNKSLIAAI